MYTTLVFSSHACRVVWFNYCLFFLLEIFLMLLLIHLLPELLHNSFLFFFLINEYVDMTVREKLGMSKVSDTQRREEKTI